MNTVLAANWDSAESCCKILCDEVLPVAWLTGWDGHIPFMKLEIQCLLLILEFEKSYLGYYHL